KGPVDRAGRAIEPAGGEQVSGNQPNRPKAVPSVGLSLTELPCVEGSLLHQLRRLRLVESESLASVDIGAAGVGGLPTPYRPLRVGRKTVVDSGPPNERAKRE